MRPIHFHNTLSGKKEPFEAIAQGSVRMYVCGITPYDESHLGHARCYVLFDTLRRFLRLSGYRVTYVQNFTDVDDKIIARAKESGTDPKAVAEKYIQDYFERMRLLNVEPADAYPRVTEAVPQIVDFIARLLDKGLAYPLDGDVYYAVRRFAPYGRLSKRALDEMVSGARVDVDDRKQDPLDFALWKKAKPDEPAWDSPWGRGRPGWHIECSVMSMAHLGESFDIHGGGQDLIFPHHENEIAQSEGLTGKPFARTWIHNGFVTVNQEKMSKSLGNFFALRDIFARVPPAAVRFFLLSRHYRTPLDFSDDVLAQSQTGLARILDTYEMGSFLAADLKNEASEVLEEWRERALQALSDDFNTEKALAVVFQLRHEMLEKIQSRDLPWLARALRTVEFLLRELLGVPFQTRLDAGAAARLRAKLEERARARQAKDWKAADAIRGEIESMGYAIEDTPQGPVAKPRS